jgi:carbonic anhydrase
MKKVLLLVSVAGSMFVSPGCATPAYSPTERRQQIARNWDYEGRQATDDWDHILLLRPASRLTIWNVR